MAVAEWLDLQARRVVWLAWLFKQDDGGAVGAQGDNGSARRWQREGDGTGQGDIQGADAAGEADQARSDPRLKSGGAALLSGLRRSFACQLPVQTGTGS